MTLQTPSYITDYHRPLIPPSIKILEFSEIRFVATVTTLGTVAAMEQGVQQLESDTAIAAKSPNGPQ